MLRGLVCLALLLACGPQLPGTTEGATTIDLPSTTDGETSDGVTSGTTSGAATGPTTSGTSSTDTTSTSTGDESLTATASASSSTAPTATTGELPCQPVLCKSDDMCAPEHSCLSFGGGFLACADAFGNVVCAPDPCDVPCAEGSTVCGEFPCVSGFCVPPSGAPFCATCNPACETGTDCGPEPANCVSGFCIGARGVPFCPPDECEDDCRTHEDCGRPGVLFCSGGGKCVDASGTLACAPLN